MAKKNHFEESMQLFYKAEIKFPLKYIPIAARNIRKGNF
jgi:hypothetical protein